MLQEQKKGALKLYYLPRGLPEEHHIQYSMCNFRSDLDCIPPVVSGTPI